MPQKRGDMELDRLDHNGSVTNGSMTGMAATGGPRRSPAPARSPVSPVDGYGYNQVFEKEPLVSGGQHRSPRSSPAPYGQPYAPQDDYRRGSPAQNLSPARGAGEGYAQNQTYGRHSPAQQQQPSYNQEDDYSYQPSYAQAPTQRYHSPSPPGQNYNSNNNTNYDNYGPSPVQQQPSHTLGYPHSEPPSYEQPEPVAQPVSAYPGQRSYTPQSQTSYPGQKTYQAFNPGQ
jgi:hypothetical protein